MKRFKNILVVVDPEKSHAALLDRAVKLAGNNRAALTLAEVVEEIPGELQTVVKSKFSQDLQHSVVRESQAALEKLLVPVRAEGIRAEAKILAGKAFIEIIQEVLRNNRDLVMIAHEHEPGLRTKIFTSTIQHLMRKCPCPVWIIKPRQHKKFARILVAIDPVIPPYEDPDPERDELNIKLLEIGKSLAGSEQAELFVFNAWMVLFEGWMQSRTEFVTEYIDDLRHDKRLSHKRVVAGLIDRHAPGVPKKNILIWKGDAGRLIPRIVREKGVELLIMGTVSRSGVSGLLIGNTAEKVLNDVDCSVLAVKPDGFISPVKLED